MPGKSKFQPRKACFKPVEEGINTFLQGSCDCRFHASVHILNPKWEDSCCTRHWQAKRESCRGPSRVEAADLQQAGAVNGDKELAAPAVALAHAHLALLHAVLPHHGGEHLGPLLKRNQEWRMPTTPHMLCVFSPS